MKLRSFVCILRVFSVIIDLSVEVLEQGRKQMNIETVTKICNRHFGAEPQSVSRCLVGHGNYVSIVECAGGKYVVRCSEEDDAYEFALEWLPRLSEAGIPVPRIIANGRDACEYIILSYIEGRDLGEVYPMLDDRQKRGIAAKVAEIQRRAATVCAEVSDGWRWSAFVEEMLDRAEQRIRANGYFDAGKVDMLREQMAVLSGYFDNVQPAVYLDDISTKNLLVHNGEVTGVIDVDWIEKGDRLTFAAMTYVALLNMDCDTDYVDYLLDELKVDEMGMLAFRFYSLMYCTDFMGERGMRFGDKQIPVDDRVIERLNNIFDRLWQEWEQEKEKHI